MNSLSAAPHSSSPPLQARFRQPLKVPPPSPQHSSGLTGLPNRAMLDWYIGLLFAAPETPPKTSALLVIELNEVRTMRYAFGESVCNRFLRIAGQRLREMAIGGQFVSALNHGEFAFVISKCAGRDECLAVADRIIACNEQPIVIDDKVYFSSINIGIAFPDVANETPADTLHRAQAALHHAAVEGPGVIKVADCDSARLAREEMSMLNAVHNACERGEFSLQFQPIVDLNSGDLRSYEALLRWKNPQFGAVSPERFIPLLEQNGGILEVGEWVLRTACRQARVWNEGAARPVRISVNVSAIQFETDDFESRLLNILAETRCQPEWIELEFTESIAVHVMSRVRHRMASIANYGITFAIDDFGAGYSSFGYLANMPVHHLKLDRALVTNLPHDRKGVAIVRAIQMLADSLGLSVTAEGIERPEQQEFCKQAGITQGQGFLLGMPASPNEENDVSAKTAIRALPSA